MAKRSSNSFLPGIFQTATNQKFLNATLDQLIQEPSLKPIYGYIGHQDTSSNFRPGDAYIKESDMYSQFYQLEPGLSVKNKLPNSDVVVNRNVYSYVDMLNQVANDGAITTDQGRLFSQEYYNYNAFTDLDKLVNYRQYYWVPSGPMPLDVNASVADTLPSEYHISRNSTLQQLEPGYTVAELSQVNPKIYLVRGRTYQFHVDQTGNKFWIQTEPGLTGVTQYQHNINSREVLGVHNNGTDSGVITFNVPLRTAQDTLYQMPVGAVQVDLITDLSYQDLQGNFFAQFLKTQDLDGTRLGTSGTRNIIINNSNNWPANITAEQRLGIWQVSVDSSNLIQLTYVSDLPRNTRVFVQEGNTYGHLWVYRDLMDNLQKFPALTALMDKLYYQDSTDAGYVGEVILLDPDPNSILNISDILGATEYISPNGVRFSNGLKVIFSGNVNPPEYNGNTYVVENLSKGIRLMPWNEFVTPELFNYYLGGEYDSDPYDNSGYDSSKNNPVVPDYITISRGSLDRNAWSRNNRWFHRSILEQVATNLGHQLVLDSEFQAQRPIVEFVPDIQLYAYGQQFLTVANIYDQSTTDAFNQVMGLNNLSLQSEFFFHETVGDALTGTSTLVLGDMSQVAVGQIITGLGIATNTRVTKADTTTNTITLNQALIADVLAGEQVYFGQYNSDGILLVDGIKIIFAADTRPEIRKNIYQVKNVRAQSYRNSIFQTLTFTASGTRVLQLANVSSIRVADLVSGAGLVPGCTVVQIDTARNQVYLSNSLVQDSTAGNSYTFTNEATQITLMPVATAKQGDVVLIDSGIQNQGIVYHYDNGEWKRSQQKAGIPQPPLFDITDMSGNSMGDNAVYPGTNFTGNRLFGYADATGHADTRLGIPIRYQNIGNIGDIVFTNYYQTDTFHYSNNRKDTIVPVRLGYATSIDPDASIKYLTGWDQVKDRSRQKVVYSQDVQINQLNGFKFKLDYLESFYQVNLKVRVDGQPVLRDTYTLQSDGTYITITMDQDLDVGNRLTVSVTGIPDQYNQTYEIPVNLAVNNANQLITDVTLGQMRNHVVEICSNSLDFAGEPAGISNLRDIDLSGIPGRLLQHSAGLWTHSILSLNSDNNLITAIRNNMTAYGQFKINLQDQISNSQFADTTDIKACLDQVLKQLSQDAKSSDAYYLTDMAPQGAATYENTYTIINLGYRTYNLNLDYANKDSSYLGVLVYRNNSQLARGRDYTISGYTLKLQPGLALFLGDEISIYEYADTRGGVIPATPSKLALYPCQMPVKEMDHSYRDPVMVVRGHDGSVTPAFNDYRDDILLEYELRVYNNCQTQYSADATTGAESLRPGAFRKTDYTLAEWNQLLAISLLEWSGQYAVDVFTNDITGYDPFTYNYSSGQDILFGNPVPGYWRGIYQYFFDTDTPHLTPWQMLGFVQEPVWWQLNYGTAPYTSANVNMWQDLEMGFVRGFNSSQSRLDVRYSRPGLSQIIPVDDHGVLKSPDLFLVTKYQDLRSRDDWRVGDWGPVESSWRRSSYYPFAIQMACALARPAEYASLNFNTRDFVRDSRTKQLVDQKTNTRTWDYQLSDSTDYRTGTNVWVRDLMLSRNQDLQQTWYNYVQNSQINLVYKMAGYADKSQLTLIADQVSPQTTNNSVLIPPENYQVVFSKSSMLNRVVYSAVTILKTDNGYKIYGFDTYRPYFLIMPVRSNGDHYALTVGSDTVQIYNGYDTNMVSYPYGTVFATKQLVVDFLMGYSKYLTTQGFIFDSVLDDQQTPQDFTLAVKEFLFWDQQRWGTDVVISVTPAGVSLKFHNDYGAVDDLSNRSDYTRLVNSDGRTLKGTDYRVYRDGNDFQIQLRDQTKGIHLLDLGVVQYEHSIVLDNRTVFNDVIFDSVMGNRQSRIKIQGYKTQDWNGSLYAPGFLVNVKPVEAWQPYTDYYRGDVVAHKTHYHTAKDFTPGSKKFQQSQWYEISGDLLQHQLIPNPAYNASQFTGFYDIDRADINSTADRYARHATGFSQRGYLSAMGLDIISQHKFYLGMLKQKGSQAVVQAFVRAQNNNYDTQVELQELFAIRLDTFGNTSQQKLYELDLAGIRSINNQYALALIAESATGTDGVNNYRPGDLLQIPAEYSTDAFAGPAKPSVLANSGYVRSSDVSATVFNIQKMDQIDSLTSVLGEGSLIWVANDNAGQWAVYRVTLTDRVYVVECSQTGPNQITFTTDTAHGLQVLDIIMLHTTVINSNNKTQTDLAGFYTVTSVSGAYFTVSVKDNLNLGNQAIHALVYKLVNVRFPDKYSFANFQPARGWKAGDLVYIDQADNGYAVLQNTDSWKLNTTISPIYTQSSDLYGELVVISSRQNYSIVSSPGRGNAGAVYLYTLDTSNNWGQSARLNPTSSNVSNFGSAVSMSDQDRVFISGTCEGLGIVHVANIVDREIHLQQIIYYDMVSGNLGTSQAVSSDGNWLYLSDSINGNIWSFRYTEVNSVSVSYVGDASSVEYAFPSDAQAQQLRASDVTVVVDQVIQIPELDYILSTNPDNILFNTAPDTDSVITIHYRSYYKLVNIHSGVASSDWGASISTDATGRRVVVGHKSYGSYGRAVILEREVRVINAQANQSVFHVDNLGPANMQVAPGNYNDLYFFNPVITVDGHLRTDYVLGRRSILINMIIEIDTFAVLTVPAHGLADQDAVQISGPVPLNFVNNDTYYVQYIDADHMKLCSDRDLTTVVLYTDLNPYTLNSCSLSYQVATLSQPVDAGAQVTIEYPGFIHVRDITSDSINPDLRFGQQVRLDATGSELLAGAPGYRYTNNSNGAIFRYLDTAYKYNVAYSTVTNAVVPANSCLYINDQLVRFNTGTTQDILDSINQAAILGVTATLATGKIVITAQTPSVLRLRNGQIDVLSRMGIAPWNSNQIILSPQNQDTEQFGERISISPDAQRLVVGATVSDNYKITTFDNGTMTLDNRTIVALREKAYRSGTAYLYELQGPGTTSKPDKYVYASTMNHKDLATQDRFGTGVAVSDNWLVVGSPNGAVNNKPQGSIYVYKNADNVRVWQTIRQQGNSYNSAKITHAYLYDRKQQQKMQDLTVLDPLHGKFTPVVASKLDYISNTDPAIYTDAPNALTFSNDQRNAWGYQQVGRTWWDTNSIKLMDQDQGDATFRLNTWNSAFPNSSISIYQWIESSVLPGAYSKLNTGATPLYTQNEVYSSRTVIDSNTGSAVVRYYFWVRNSTLNGVSTSELEQILAQPRQQDQPYLAVLDTNLLGMYNCQGLLNSDTSLIIRTSDTDSVVTHTEWMTFDDGSDLGTSMDFYDKLRHSLSGQDDHGRTVPDLRLPEKQRYGTSIRPRQTLFADRYQARESFFQQLNDFCRNNCLVLTRPEIFQALQAHEPEPDVSKYMLAVADLTELSYLDVRIYPLASRVLVHEDTDAAGGWSLRELRLDNNNGRYWYLYQVQTFDVRRYWTYTDWYGANYTQGTQPTHVVDTERDISKLRLNLGDVILIRNSDAGGWKLVVAALTQIQLLAQQGATIQFSSNLYDNNASGLGLDGSSLDSTSYGQDCNQEVSVIFQAVVDHLLTQEYRPDLKRIVRSLINLMQTQTRDADWVMKTSLVDIYHRVRGLSQLPVFLPDVQDSIQQFFQEIKPFHVYLKQYVARYDNTPDPDQASLDITDFDLQPYYNSVTNTYRSPQLGNTTDTDALQYPVYGPWLQHHTYAVGQVLMIKGGSNYVSNSVRVQIFGDGTGAKASAIVVNGAIDQILVTDGGKGYTFATVIITGICDEPARASAHLRPGPVRNFNSVLRFDRYTYKNSVQDWQPHTEYVRDQVVSYADPAFRCEITHNSSDRFQMLNWRLLVVKVWTPDTEYNQDDVIVYRSSLWDYTGPVTYVVTSNFTSSVHFDTANMRPYAGKWLDNAADRIWSFYHANPGMAGRDLSQLMTGIKHGGVQVLGPGFDQTGGYDQPGYDQTAYDPDYTDALGLDIIRGPQAIDTIYTSEFTDQMLGIRPEDIITQGGGFVDANNVPAPEELVPGRLFDTLGITVTTNAQDILVNYINPEIRQAAYVSDGIQTVYSWKHADLPQSGEEFVWVAVERYGPLDLDQDYQIDLAARTITLATPAPVGRVIQINIWGSTGFAQCSYANYTSDGVTKDYLLPDVSLTDCAQVYVRIQQDRYTDFTLSEVQAGVMVHLAHKASVGDIISLHGYQLDTSLRSYASIKEQTFITPVGAVINYDLVLADPVLSIQPAGVYTIARVNNHYLTPSSQAYYTANGMTSTYDLSQLRTVANVNKVRDSDIVVVVDGQTKQNRIDYQVLRVTGQWPQIRFNQTPAQGSQIVISDSSYSEYRVHTPANVSLDPDTRLVDSDKVHVLTLTNHDMIDLKTWVYTGNNLGTYVTIDEGFDGNNSPLDDKPFDNNLVKIRTDLPFRLPINVSDPGDMIITINGMLQMPYTDYRMPATDSVIFKQQIVDSDIIVFRVFGNANRNRVSQFRIFKDLTDNTTYQVVSSRHTTYLTQDLYQRDQWIYVADIDKLYDSDPTNNQPGVIFIGGERITYGIKDLANSRLGNIRRGTAGTGAAEKHKCFTVVTDANPVLDIPQSAETSYITEGIQADWLGLTLGSYMAANVVTGTRMTEPRTEVTGSITINGQDTSIGYLTPNTAANRSKITNAINSVSALTGVTATDTGSDDTGVTLTDELGSDIVVAVTGGFTNSSGTDLGYTGLSTGTHQLTTGTTVTGSAMVAPASSSSTRIVINNTAINIFLTTDTIQNRQNITDAINVYTVVTGVTATDTGSDTTGITLTSIAGTGIDCELQYVLIENKAGQVIGIDNGQRLLQGMLWQNPGETLHESQSIQARYIRSA